MIIGAHSIVYSANAEADRAFLRDILKFPNVDVGGGWLIFGLPPSEVAVHPGKNDQHEFYLMCDDVDAFVETMKSRGLGCSEVQALSWGRLTRVTLPGGGQLGVYEPRYARPKTTLAKAARRKPAKPKAARRPRKQAPPKRRRR